MIEPCLEKPNLKKRVSGHLRTITQHKLLVMDLCFKAGLYKQGLLHDLSKYSPVELKTGFKFYSGDRSPNAHEREQSGYSRAWLHHKGRNKHHFEYWTDIIPPRKNPAHILEDIITAENPAEQVANYYAPSIGVPMPTRYVIEMFCDRVAACKVYEKEAYTDASALAYFRKESSRGILMHPETQKMIESLLLRLSEEGEEATLRYIREEIVKPRASYGNERKF